MSSPSVASDPGRRPSFTPSGTTSLRSPPPRPMSRRFGLAPEAQAAHGWMITAQSVLRQAFHPPLRDASFWALQVAVVTLAGFHFYLDSSGILESTTFPTGSPVGLLLLPVLYSALRYGLAGSASTAIWATLLWFPDLLLPHGHPANDLIDLAVVDAVAIFVGERIERTRIQQRRAEAAEEERRETEHRYRELFQTNFLPIVIVDEDGVITEANPAAAEAFGDRIIGRTTETALSISHEGIGCQTEASIQSVDTDDGTLRIYRLRVAPVRPGGKGGRDFRQLVFQDLTEEYRERAAVRSYAARVLAAQEEERRHIAHEIHDDPLQLLIHLARRMDSLIIAGGPGPASAALLETRVELLEIIGRLRDVARGLRPPGLDQLGLVAAVRGLLAFPSPRFRGHRHPGASRGRRRARSFPNHPRGGEQRDPSCVRACSSSGPSIRQGFAPDSRGRRRNRFRYTTWGGPAWLGGHTGASPPTRRRRGGLFGARQGHDDRGPLAGPAAPDVGRGLRSVHRETTGFSPPWILAGEAAAPGTSFRHGT
jgi:PAS domain S-box-containing protein